jgi:hypothetical protein
VIEDLSPWGGRMQVLGSESQGCNPLPRCPPFENWLAGVDNNVAVVETKIWFTGLEDNVAILESKNWLTGFEDNIIVIETKIWFTQFDDSIVILE